MPGYRSSAFDGISLPDVRGLDLPGLNEARIEAMRLAGGLLRDGATIRRLGRDWRMEATDDAGALLFRLDFTVTDAARADPSGP